MNLKFMQNLRQSIKGRRKPGNALFPLVTVLLVFTFLLFEFVYRRNLLQINYEEIDNSLTDALLAGAVINYFEYGSSGKVMIQEGEEPSPADRYFTGSYEKFRECLKVNLDLDDSFMALSPGGINGEVYIREYRVYNYIEDGDNFFITETGFSNGNGYAVRYGLNEPVYVRANDGTIEITETSVYARIEFTLQLAGYMSWLDDLPQEYFRNDYCLTRLIGIAH